MEKYDKALKILKEYKQYEILKELEKNKNEKLVEQILKIDFEQIENLYNLTNKKSGLTNEKIEGIEYVSKIENEDEIRKIGEDVIKNRKYAVVTMAGGQRNKIRT